MPTPGAPSSRSFIAQGGVPSSIAVGCPILSAFAKGGTQPADEAPGSTEQHYITLGTRIPNSPSARSSSLFATAAVASSSAFFAASVSFKMWWRW